MSRKLDLVVISDTHLGTYGCQAKELYQYLKSIKPDKLIINGDFIDIWQFKKNYFPKDHLKIIKRIITLASKGTEVIYITGNHDELLRKFANFKLGNFELVNKKFLILDTKKVWIFHGDVFDASVQHSKWIAKLGGVGYDWLIRINSISNWILQKLGREKYSFSKRIKASVKKAVKFIGDFEKTAAELAIENKYDYVICGHIHQPQIKKIVTQKGECTYLNSGDWVENLTALEYNEGEWSLYTYEKEHYKNQEVDLEETDLKEINTLLRDVVPNYFK
jgi:UDP-2,3-diacylglucosamine pyrophosphatase LpxH